MTYMRIDTNKFWGWVVVSLLVGLGIGLAIMFWQGAQSAGQITKLQRQLESKASEAGDAAAELQARLASAETSIADLSAGNAQLTADLAAANAQIATLQKSATASTSTSITITSRAVSPTSVSASGTITLTVKVKGKADKVRMQIRGTSYDTMHYLTHVSTSGGIETWRAKVKAPSKKGTYRYYAGAFLDGKKVTMPGTSAWSFQVK
ncbi:MAG: hypothetical protein Q7W30_02140 [Coriobacteriia bacterium]|nr:hypothetical protein [Coriobacteriia bacterium]